MVAPSITMATATRHLKLYLEEAASVGSTPVNPPSPGHDPHFFALLGSPEDPKTPTRAPDTDASNAADPSYFMHEDCCSSLSVVVQSLIDTGLSPTFSTSEAAFDVLGSLVPSCGINVSSHVRGA